ncbi:hypothetical protein AAKU64_002827 [Undibacterium sp. GrIS 1.8]|uniref:hypothetical protein n=1 Tax=Undibacterium sp. GrIS 1.8 TaxID=3143934 RepID=UPI00339085D1
MWVIEPISANNRRNFKSAVTRSEPTRKMENRMHAQAEAKNESLIFDNEVDEFNIGKPSWTATLARDIGAAALSLVFIVLLAGFLLSLGSN